LTIDYELNLLRKLVEINTDSVLKEGYDECASILIEEAQKNSLDISVIDARALVITLKVIMSSFKQFMKT